MGDEKNPIDLKGNVHEKGFFGGYHRKEGLFGPEKDEGFFGPNVKEGFFGKERARGPLGGELSADDGTPLYQSSGGRGGGSGEGALVGLIAIVVVVAFVIAIIVVAAIVVATVAVVAWWARGLYRSIRRDITSGEGVSGKTVAWAGSGIAVAALIAVGIAANPQLFRNSPLQPGFADILGGAALPQPGPAQPFSPSQLEPTLAPTPTPQAPIDPGSALPAVNATIKGWYASDLHGTISKFEKLAAWIDGNGLDVCFQFTGSATAPHYVHLLGLGPSADNGWQTPIVSGGVGYGVGQWDNCISVAGGKPMVDLGGAGADPSATEPEATPDMPTLSAVNATIKGWYASDLHGTISKFEKLAAWIDGNGLDVCFQFTGSATAPHYVHLLGLGPSADNGWQTPIVSGGVGYGVGQWDNCISVAGGKPMVALSP